MLESRCGGTIEIQYANTLQAGAGICENGTLYATLATAQSILDSSPVGSAEEPRPFDAG
jgi:hypothetical protein